MAIVGLAMIVPNLLAIGGNSFDADLSPFNLSGIDFDDWITPSSTHPGGPGDNLLFHARCAVSFLLVGLLLHAVPFVRSLKKYLFSPMNNAVNSPLRAGAAQPPPAAEGTSE